MTTDRAFAKKAESMPTGTRDRDVKSGRYEASGIRHPPTWELAAAFMCALLAFLVEISMQSAPNSAIFYVVALLVVFKNARGREIVAFGVLTAVLSLLAFGITHDRPLGAAGVIRVAAEAGGLGFVTAILVQSAKERRAYNWRYRSIFKRSHFPLWELDFSVAVAALERLRATGVMDITEYGLRTPNFLAEIKENIKFLDMNDAMFEHFGMTPGVDAMPQNLLSISIDDVQLLRILQMIIEGGDHYSGLGRTTRVDGRTVDVFFGVSVDRTGTRHSSVIGMLIDVSEKEEANKALAAARAELARASRVAAVGTVSVSIAHELNQPIGAILLNAHTCMRYLRRRIPDVRAALSAIERVTREGDRAAAIVRETRDMVAKRANRHEPIKLSALVSEVIDLSSREIKESGAKHYVRILADDIWIKGDRLTLLQAMINLVGNALQAIYNQPSEGRQLVISLARDGQQAVIGISDSGAGIDEQNLERIFDPFFTTKEDGTGMGLAISRSAIEAHDGSIKAYNQEGGGALFECKLPLWEDRTLEVYNVPTQTGGEERRTTNDLGRSATPAVGRILDASLGKKQASSRPKGYVIGTGI